MKGKSIISGAQLQNVNELRKFDLRTRGKVTPVKNQGACGACWAFSSIGALESSLLPSETRNFSENNLKNTQGSTHCGGGFFSTAQNYFAKWGGPVNASDDPYSTTSYISPSGLITQKHVLESYWIPNRSGPLDNANLKWAIMNYGGVSVGFLWSDAAYNATNSAYYFNPDCVMDGGHAVVLVGWDDDFDKSKFNSTPPGNGAFILKNSWGTNWGDGGYFYVSYYDTYLGQKDNMVFGVAESSSAKTTIYQYDDEPTYFTGYSTTTAWMANVFVSTASEALSAIGFYNNDINSAYEASIYLNAGTSPVSGTLATAFAGTLKFAGYHVVSLPKPVVVPSGTKFSIVIKQTNPTSESPIATNLKGNPVVSSRSYISPDGVAWQDMAVKDEGAYYYYDYVGIKALMQASTQTVLAAVTPYIGIDTGTVSVALTGSNFHAGSTVKLSKNGETDIVGTDTVVVSSGLITCQLNLLNVTTGTWTITVTGPDSASVSLTNGFTVSWPEPQITAVTPNTAANTGSVDVTVNGTLFQAGTTIKLVRTGKPDIQATAITVLSSTTLTCTLPIMGVAGGYWKMAVTNQDGNTTLYPGSFTVTTVNPMPTVTAVTPSSGCDNVDYIGVELTGTGFVSSSTVRIENSSTSVAATSVTVASAEKIYCYLPARELTPGLWNITAINPDGWEVSLSNGFNLQNAWSVTGGNIFTRQYAQTVLLKDGRVLATGGVDTGYRLQVTAEIYDPAAGTWSATGSLANTRDKVTLLLLPDGKVFASPEYGYDYTTLNARYAPAEIYDPQTGLWTKETGAMNTPRWSASYTLLSDGRVLACGGYNTESEFISSAEIFDPASGLWLPAAPMAQARASHPVALLPDGRVLAAGGESAAGLGSAEIYNPASNTWAAAPAMAEAMPNAAVLLLADGSVSVIEPEFKFLQTYNPSANSWGAKVTLSENRFEPRAVLLPDNRVMLAGYTYSSNNPVILLDSAATSWAYGSTPNVKHGPPSLTTLKTGKVLLTGYNATSSAELYTPVFSTGTPLLASVSPQTGHNNATRSVTVTGTGFVSGLGFKLTRPGLADIAAQNVSVLSATSFSCDLPLTGALAGAWNGVATNPDGTAANMPNAFFVTYVAPTVSAITPATAPNTGAVEITNLAGSGFQAGAAIKLVRTGYTTHACTGTVVNSGKLTCTMPVWNAEPGLWDVQAVNIDGSTATLASAFTVTTTSPVITGITPVVGFSSAAQVAVTLSGQNFLAGSSVTLTRDGRAAIIATAVTAVSPSALTFAVSLSTANGGAWSVTVTNPYGLSATLVDGFSVRADTTNTVSPDAAATIIYNGPSGPIRAEIPAGTFSQTVTLAISSPSFVPPPGGTLRAAAVAMEITASQSLQPQRPVVLTLSYLPADVVGLDESKLILARYDTGRTVWVPLTGCGVNTTTRTVTCNTDHFSVFQIMQASPSGDLANIKYYPNPLRPAKGQSYAKMNFTNLPADAEIKIFTVLGEAVRTLRADSTGMSAWDGKDNSGGDAASGTYIVRITGAGADKIIKVSVQR